MLLQPASTARHRTPSRTIAAARDYHHVLPWLPLILSSLAVFFIGAFYFIGWMAITGAGIGVDGSVTKAADVYWYFALTAMFLWAFCLGGSVIALGVAVAKGHYRSLWQGIAILAASTPIGLVAWAIATH